MRADPRPSAHRSRGLVLLAVLVFLALSGLWIALASDVWATARQRDREEELLFVGDQYRRAIESYWRMSPGTVRTLPASLDALLADDRFPMPVRHLRRLYPDPVTGGDFEVVRDGNGVAGVHSPSTDAPRKVAGFPARYQHFAEATGYDQWRFVYLPPRRVPRAAPPRPAQDAGSGAQSTPRNRP